MYKQLYISIAEIFPKMSSSVGGPLATLLWDWFDLMFICISWYPHWQFVSRTVFSGGCGMHNTDMTPHNTLSLTHKHQPLLHTQCILMQLNMLNA